MNRCCSICSATRPRGRTSASSRTSWTRHRPRARSCGRGCRSSLTRFGGYGNGKATIGRGRLAVLRAGHHGRRRPAVPGCGGASAARRLRRECGRSGGVARSAPGDARLRSFSRRPRDPAGGVPRPRQGEPATAGAARRARDVGAGRRAIRTRRDSRPSCEASRRARLRSVSRRRFTPVTRRTSCGRTRTGRRRGWRRSPRSSRNSRGARGSSRDPGAGAPALTTVDEDDVTCRRHRPIC